MKKLAAAGGGLPPVAPISKTNQKHTYTMKKQKNETRRKRLRTRQSACEIVMFAFWRVEKQLDAEGGSANGRVMLLRDMLGKLTKTGKAWADSIDYAFATVEGGWSEAFKSRLFWHLTAGMNSWASASESGVYYDRAWGIRRAFGLSELTIPSDCFNIQTHHLEQVGGMFITAIDEALAKRSTLDSKKHLWELL